RGRRGGADRAQQQRARRAFGAPPLGGRPPRRRPGDGRTRQGRRHPGGGPGALRDLPAVRTAANTPRAASTGTASTAPRRPADRRAPWPPRRSARRAPARRRPGGAAGRGFRDRSGGGEPEVGAEDLVVDRGGGDAAVQQVGAEPAHERQRAAQVGGEAGGEVEGGQVGAAGGRLRGGGVRLLVPEVQFGAGDRVD